MRKREIINVNAFPSSAQRPPSTSQEVNEMHEMTVWVSPCGPVPWPSITTSPEQAPRSEDEAASWGMSRLLFSPERCLKQQRLSDCSKAILTLRSLRSLTRMIVASVKVFKYQKCIVTSLFSYIHASFLPLRVCSWCKVRCSWCSWCVLNIDHFWTNGVMHSSNYSAHNHLGLDNVNSTIRASSHQFVFMFHLGTPISAGQQFW